MDKYIIKVLPAKGCDEKHMPEKEEMEGVECSGYVILAFENEQVYFESISGVSVDMLRKYLMTNKDNASIILQAAQIAEGYIKALETRRIAERKSIDKSVKNMLLEALGNKNHTDK